VNYTKLVHSQETLAQVKGGTARNPGNCKPLTFARMSYPTFTAEVATTGKGYQDYVVHFYAPTTYWTNKGLLTEDNLAQLKKFWRKAFPNLLSELAQSFFDADYPRLRAAYTEENHSWWFRADACAATLSPEDRIQLFFDKLNEQVLPTFPVREQEGTPAGRE
jgi:hypothetical protein